LRPIPKGGDGGKRLNRDDLAQHCAGAKLRDHTDKPPTANTARLTWEMVLQDTKKVRPAKKR
jgi:hypothetical protein